MISIRDEDWKALEDLHSHLEATNDPLSPATRLCFRVIESCVIGARELMQEQAYPMPRIATFNDIPPKGWTGPNAD